jgi:hypothetical protein
MSEIRRPQTFVRAVCVNAHVRIRPGRMIVTFTRAAGNENGLQGGLLRGELLRELQLQEQICRGGTTGKAIVRQQRSLSSLEATE